MSTVASMIGLTPQGTSDYHRQHKWGDKLLRKVFGDELKQHIAEQPYKKAISSASGHRKHNIKAKLGHSSGAATITDVSDDTYQRGKLWVVPGVGEFTNRMIYKFDGDQLPVGLTASDNEEQQGSAPLPFRFSAANVSVSGGTLNLKVPGGQKESINPISCAEVTTDVTDICHASVRMTARLSQEAGVCQGSGESSVLRIAQEAAFTHTVVVNSGHFFYRNENSEMGMEYLTDPASESHDRSQESGQLWYSSQSSTSQKPSLHNKIDTPSAVGDFHRYRLDWNADFTAYYIDGKLQMKLTDNVPDQSGIWVWNNWSNSDPMWSSGPPEHDSVFQIKEITMYYNTVHSRSSSSFRAVKDGAKIEIATR